MDSYLIWLVAGFVLLIAELVTGTFFLLVLGIAAFAGSATAWFGFGFWMEALVAAIVAVAGVLWVRNLRRSSAQPDMASLDVGQTVALDTWIDRSQGVARVRYRNTLWDAVVEDARDGEAGQLLYIRAVEGNLLKVARTR